MPPTKTYKTPGVYVAELDAFPPSVVGVQTAVPAFIGYTEKAEIDGKPVLNKAVKINSMADFREIFGGAFPAEYELQRVTEEPLISDGDYDVRVDDPTNDGEPTYWRLVETFTARFQLYASMLLFYDNGGGSCYVVSVGPYSDGSVTYDKLEKGLQVIEEEQGPTMLVIPDAISLPAGNQEIPWQSDDFAKLAKKMLRQCGELQDRVSILDVYGSQYSTKNDLSAIITRFREDVGSELLSYGMGYFPFLDTSVFSSSDFTYLNVAEGQSRTNLELILTWENANLNNGGVLPTAGEGSTQFLQVEAEIAKMAADDGSNEEETRKTDQNLEASLPVLTNIQNLMARKNSKLPPSGAMAGVYTFIDGTRGVWNAPANIALTSVRAPTFKIDSRQQEDLNVPVNGKAVDAIREFTGRGTVVWGARTLDGNSRDWRYIQVRRTLIYVEQSIKLALDPFVFAANDANTWSTVVSMVSSFLQELWSQGGLMGATAQEAFSVECGIGSTMTAQDILDGYMIVQVTLQMIRPAEFIEVTFKQKMQGSGS